MTYQYFAKLWSGDTTERPSGLWRRDGDTWEYLSLSDWAWHLLAAPAIMPHPDTLVPVTVDEAAALQADRQRFARYWMFPAPPEFAHERPTLIYRRRCSPGRMVDEVFGRDNQWSRTTSIAEYKASGPHEHKELIPTDRDTAERVIQQERGITGATEL
jgi:hypothetical protein